MLDYSVVVVHNSHMVINRNIFKSLVNEIKRSEVSILLGPRQVGKTFLLNQLEKAAKNKRLRIHSYNLEIPDHSIKFNKNEKDLFDFLTEDVDIIFIDEFHYLKNASKIFKAIFDSNKEVKIFASGSSSLEIHKHLKESLAGRRLLSRIFPMDFEEYKQVGKKNPLDSYLVFGGMPGLIHQKSENDKIRLLNEIVETYIQKDIKSLIREENIRAFNTLLYLLAENQGSVTQVSSLAGDVGLTSKTISHHLSILENTYTVIPLNSYSRNIGNELKKSKKYYFFDTGIRNTLVKDFSSINGRPDAGILNETFVFLQFLSKLKPNMELKFWRNKQGEEIDFIILKNRRPFLVEVKTNLSSTEIPKAMKIFIEKYPETEGALVFSRNFKGESEFMGKRIRFLRLEEIGTFISEYF